MAKRRTGKAAAKHTERIRRRMMDLLERYEMTLENASAEDELELSDLAGAVWLINCGVDTNGETENLFEPSPMSSEPSGGSPTRWATPNGASDGATPGGARDGPVRYAERGPDEHPERRRMT